MRSSIDQETKKQLREFISRRLSAEASSSVPTFYAIAGSYLYDFPDPNSDIDIRGFHCAPGSNHMLLKRPSDSIKSDNDLDNIGKSVDLVSYELRKFGQQVAKGDFTAVELLYSQNIILSREANLIKELQSLVEAKLPLNLPSRYQGLAYSMVDKYLGDSFKNTNSETMIKQYLYALRGTLAAQYVDQQCEIEPRLPVLSNTMLDDEYDREVALKLIDHKKKGIDQPLDEDLARAAMNLMNERLSYDANSEVSDEVWTTHKKNVDEWMLNVRDATETVV